MVKTVYVCDEGERWREEDGEELVVSRLKVQEQVALDCALLPLSQE